MLSHYPGKQPYAIDKWHLQIHIQDTVQVMQAQYLPNRGRKRMILEKHTFQLKPGKESK